MQQYLQNKEGLVKNVFNKVYNKYDLMNDFMSFGIHRVWKKNLINWMSPSSDKKLIDVACGTGDLCKLFLDSRVFLIMVARPIYSYVHVLLYDWRKMNFSHRPVTIFDISIFPPCAIIPRSFSHVL